MHMILEESPTLEADPTFFEIFAQLVRESHLTHADITRKINEKSKFHALFLGKKTSRGFKYEPFHQSTLTNIVNGKDLPSTLTLYRILKLALELSEDECAWMEMKRLEEDPINHSTQTRIVVVPKPTKHQVSHVQNDEEIEWIAEKEKLEIGD